MKFFLRKIHRVDDEVLDAYLAQFEEYALPAKSIMTEAGKTEHYLYFVQEGIQKSYYLNEGKQHVIAFTYPPSFSGIPDSFLNQKPSNYFLETITKSRFLRISYEQHQELMAKYRPIETLFRKATEHVLIGVLQRHYELMAYTIEERFHSFMKRSSHLLNMIPHKDLASYLRIDPTNFSKLLSSVKI
jgi:CRP-like cAMP-binding protein